MRDCLQTSKREQTIGDAARLSDEAFGVGSVYDLAVVNLQSAVEPPFVRLWRAPYNALKWPAVMNALDTLVLRVAAIESIIEASSQGTLGQLQITTQR